MRQIVVISYTHGINKCTIDILVKERHEISYNTLKPKREKGVLSQRILWKL